VRQSQRQAAVAVRRVLDGETLGAALAAAGADGAGPARALIHELAYGTLRHWGLLDALVRTLATRPIPDRTLAALVAVALYQLEHAKAPGFAVVDQAVAAAGAIAPAAKGLVNALLRRFLRERAALLAHVARDPVARWSHPRWWIDRVARDHPQHWQAILAAGNERPPLAVRINRRRAARDAVLERWRADGIEARACGEAGAIVEPPRPVTALPGFAEGLFSVQDLGAQLAAPLLAARDGMRVLDACAAPGGKTSHVLELADVEITALDADAARIARVGENLGRLGLAGPHARCVVGDAREPAAWWNGDPFDRVLADVPCTASGVVRRHPDGKWLRRDADVAAFAKVQSAILDALWPCVAPGGLLLYATCSVFRDENDARVDAFTRDHPDALRESLTLPADVRHDAGQLLPSLPGAVHNHDGFFYALLRKA